MLRHLALLRAVNVGGRTLAMADLRALCADLGWRDVATYIQSGNVVFSAAGSSKALESALEGAIEKAAGLTVPVIVRSAADWATCLAANPFPKAARDAPNRLLMLLSKQPPAAGAAEALQARAKGGESVRLAGDALWIHAPNGIGTSKLTPRAIDAAAGSPTTGRNYRTAATLQAMLAA